MQYTNSRPSLTAGFVTPVVRAVLHSLGFNSAFVQHPRFWLSMALVALTLSPASHGAASSNRGALFTLNTSAYNSIPNQTDSTPFITATGTRTRPGVVAVSRDLLARWALPYGSRVQVVSARGCGLNIQGRIFRVEDTMARHKVRSLDIWMSTRSQAVRFGRCQVTVKKL